MTIRSQFRGFAKVESLRWRVSALSRLQERTEAPRQEALQEELRELRRRREALQRSGVAKKKEDETMAKDQWLYS